MRKTLAILVFWIVSLVSCGTTSAYTGPVSERPSVSVSYMRSFVQDDPRLPEHLRSIATANVVNASNHSMSLVLDCSVSRTLLEVPARTVSHVLLDQGDASCALTEQ